MNLYTVHQGRDGVWLIIRDAFTDRAQILQDPDGHIITFSNSLLATTFAQAKNREAANAEADDTQAYPAGRWFQEGASA